MFDIYGISIWASQKPQKIESISCVILPVKKIPPSKFLVPPSREDSPHLFMLFGKPWKRGAWTVCKFKRGAWTVCRFKRGAWTVCRFKRGLGKKEGVVDTPMHTMLRDLHLMLSEDIKPIQWATHPQLA